MHESLYAYPHNFTNTLISASQQPDGNDGDQLPSHSPVIDNDLVMALKISEQEQLIRQQELQREQEMIEEAIRLSMLDK